MKISRRDVLATGSALPLLLIGAGAQSAANFPTRLVRLVVPFTPGGSADTSARILGEKLSTMWGQSVIIENKPGAGTTIASSYVARAEATGHILYLAYNLSYAATATLYKKLSYDPLKDLAAISMVADAPFIIGVGPGVKAKTFDEFLALARENTLTFASTGTGAGPHLATEIFLKQAGLKGIHVPYKGTGEALTALLGGYVQFSFFDVAALGTLRSGQARPLAVTSRERWVQMPDVPTVAESMHSEFQITSGSCILAPSGVPEEVRMFLNTSIVQALRSPDVIKRFADQGYSAIGSTPEQLSDKIRTDVIRLGEVIRDLGLEAG